MRDNPFEEIERMVERMSEGMQPGRLAEGTVLVDVEERDDAFVVTADLPGFDREEIEVSLREETLELSASHEETLELSASHEETEETGAETGTGEYVRRERRRSDVSRSVHLPAPVDPEGGTATFENGVLSVTLPKTAAADAGTDIPVS